MKYLIVNNKTDQAKSYESFGQLHEAWKLLPRNNHTAYLGSTELIVPEFVKYYNEKVMTNTNNSKLLI